jgi:hypothetical protein
MPRRNTTSSHRRRKLTNFISLHDFIAMRACSECLRRSTAYIVSPPAESCEQYTRFNRSYELTSPITALTRLTREKDEILAQISKARRTALKTDIKIIRFRKQRRLI